MLVSDIWPVNQQTNEGANVMATTTTKRAGVRPHQIEEGSIARSLEERTAQIPSDAFLWAAGGSIIISLILKSRGDTRDAVFVGQWAPTFLLLGIYNKLVKLSGSD